MQFHLAILLLSIFSYQSIYVHGQDPKDIVDTAIDAGNFQTLVRLLTAADLVATLKGPGPFTVFAPNDAAFSKIPNATIDDLLKPENKEKLADILRYHVLNGNITAETVLSLDLPVTQETVSKKTLIIDKNGDTVKANDASVTTANVFATNGVIHVVDTVLLPPTNIVDTAVANPDFKTLVAALTAAGLVDALKGNGPFTVFAPTDAAFAKLPAGVVNELVKVENKDTLAKILQYHVTSGLITSPAIGRLTLPANITMLAGGVARVSKDGANVKINDATVTAVDIFNSNGMIHVIDTVILPPLDIVEKAIVSGNFKTLVTALKAADLVTSLKAPGPLTVFGPTDDAFAKLPAGTVDDLLKPENKDKLAEILKYHVINGRVSSSDVLAMNLPAQVTTLAQSKPIVDKDGTTVKINNAQVTTADVGNTNGLIHIVDTVLIPPTNIVDTAAGNANFKTLVAALTAAGLVDALKGNGPFTVFAPTDAAFAKLPAGVVDELVKAENKDTLAKILQYHVTSAIITSPAIGRLTLPANITMLAGGVARVSKDGANVKINDATVTAVDIFNSNGMIHVIDTVILPPLDIVERALISGNFKTLIAALKAADLVSALKAQGPLTVFAPNDDAFNKLPAGVVGELVKAENKATLQNILKYHVVDKQVTSADILAMTLPANLSMLNGNNAVLSKDGTTIKIDSAAITAADLSNTNGYIHVVDSVILPPLDIVEKALTSGTFNTLITALKAADLVTTLKGDGPFTVFAPNDDAFAKLPNGTLDDLLKPENKNKLVNTLKYHVVKDRKITSDELNPSQNLEMFSGGSVTIAKKDDQITVNGFKIIAKNVETTNGIIHVIEGVLTPQRSSAMSLHSSQSFLIALVSVFFYAYRYLF